MNCHFGTRLLNENGDWKTLIYDDEFDGKKIQSIVFPVSGGGSYKIITDTNGIRNYINYSNGDGYICGTYSINAEHIFKNDFSHNPAIVFQGEINEYQEISIETVKSKTAKIAAHLKEKGVKKGDRVCSMLPNSPEAVIAFLVTFAVVEL